VQVQGITQATAVAGGGFHTCAVVARKVLCWGFNSQGQLGNGLNESSSIPVEVSGITTAKAVVTGQRHSCALLEDGLVRCWGQNLSGTGMLGDGTGVNSNVPTFVVIDTNSPPTLLTSVEKIASTDTHACALRTNGELFCWGYNNWGQLGIDDNTNESSLIATKAVLFHASIGATAITAIGAGGSFSCATLNDGSVRCWGYPWGGALGDGNDTYIDATPKMTYPPSVSGPLALAVGTSHACVILPNLSHNAQCWGTGGIGNGSTKSLVPVDVKVGPIANATNLVQIQAIAAGDEHTCAIVAGGTVYCWGSGDAGQLGTGNLLDSTTAQPVVGL
jgi:alpha-tubulin suppressor-like RCC1 family protein